jgi:hypothetical protein
MLEILSDLLWWHWIVFGIILLIMEMFTGTFILLGLGIAGIIVGIVDVIYPLPLSVELTLWIIFSLFSIALWFKYMKDNSVEKSGQSNYSLDTLGTIRKSIQMNERGTVYFDTPVLGNTLWTATAKENLTPNTRVKIIEIKGQLIEVAKL